MAIKVKKNEGIQVGAAMPPRFARRFQKYCKTNDVKQKALLRHLIEWWLDQSDEVQGHVYNARFDALEKCIVSEYEAKQAVGAAADEAVAAKQKQKSGHPGPKVS